MRTFQFFVIYTVLLFLATIPAFTQDSAGSSQESEFYVVQIPIERIYAHNKGYIIEYRKTPMIDRQLYLPIDWFIYSKETKEPLKGEIILLGSGKVWPHLSIYYKDGAIDHIRVYVRKESWHQTWGYTAPSSSLDAKFDNLSELKIDLY
ncbi:MAG: hypothetical protein LBD07_05675 [Spirochaetaceae bacterium]|jgi:hypothetical protein|nr:hypothetical protein [Spirochaetaceae bacterium]